MSKKIDTLALMAGNIYAGYLAKWGGDVTNCPTRYEHESIQAAKRIYNRLCKEEEQESVKTLGAPKDKIIAPQ